jgi:O-antigen/teichoic acid export membrane protein
MAEGKMSGIRRALVVTTSERYINLAANFIMTIIVSRLLTPAEIGVWAIGMAIAALALSAREFTTGTFLVQRAELSREDVRGAFTVMLLMNAAIAAALALLAPLLASIYGEVKLVAYLRVAAAAVLLEVIASPLMALMRRDMAFTDLAIVNIASVAVFSIVTIGLAALGFSYMSFAWAWAISAATSGVLALYLRPDYWVLRPLLRQWRGMLTFGGYNGVNVFLYRLYEALPTFILSRLVSFDAAGLYNRALLVCQVPDKLFLGGALPVILPALSAEVRAGRDLKVPYLRAVSFMTAMQWPALIMLAILAQPAVHILLGDQWIEVVPLVRIIALASLFSFSAELNYPVLVSVGAMRDLLLRGLIAWPVSALLIASASLFGLTATALSFFVIVPFQAYVSLWFVRRHIALQWSELVAALWKSAVIAACSAAGPIVIAAGRGMHLDMSGAATLAAVAMAALGWLAGVWLTRHPLADEIRNAGDALRRTALWGRLSTLP